MAAPRLTTAQKDALLTWLSAGYTESLIRYWFIYHGWQPLDKSALTYYRRKWAAQIDAACQQRQSLAISVGLALKEERIKRLVEHADELEAIKWLPDEQGRLWNEKAWRATLDDIAKEMGHRKQGIEHSTMGDRSIEVIVYQSVEDVT